MITVAKIEDNFNNAILKIFHYCIEKCTVVKLTLNLSPPRKSIAALRTLRKLSVLL